MELLLGLVLIVIWYLLFLCKLASNLEANPETSSKVVVVVAAAAVVVVVVVVVVAAR